MKKLLLLVCLGVLLFSFVSCSCNKEEVPAPKTVTVSFETYIDTKIPKQQVQLGSIIIEPTVEMKRAGYHFLGWYNGQREWNFKKDTVSQDITLAAKWDMYLSFVEKDGELFVAGCDLLNTTEVEIPETYNGKNIVGILPHAFADHKKIKTVYIPSTVKVIGEGAFFGCAALETVYCTAQTKPDGWDDNIMNTGAQLVFGYNK